MNAEGVTAILGLVLLEQPDHEVRIPIETVEGGLPADSGVQVYHDEANQELVVRIQHFGNAEEQEVMAQDEL